jgi:hypothetical protein
VIHRQKAAFSSVAVIAWRERVPESGSGPHWRFANSIDGRKRVIAQDGVYDSTETDQTVESMLTGEYVDDGELCS